jgi:hypothetical protein
MSLNTGDQVYNNGKKYGQKGTLCGPNTGQIYSLTNLGHLAKIKQFSQDYSLILST